MSVITRKFEFDSGHRVLGHEGKCRHLHGHRYVAEVTVQAEQLDGLSRVVDFSDLKSVIGGWIDQHWDHNLLLNDCDSLLVAIRKLNESAPIEHEVVGWEDVIFHGKEPYIMKGNPTAENMASVLYAAVLDLLRDHQLCKGLKLVNVRIYETPNCWADFPGVTSPKSF